MRLKFLFPLLVLTTIWQACSEPVEIGLLGEDDWQRLRTEAQGKILVVNVWATWCAPCVEEFPALVAVAEASDQGKYQFIAVSLDYPDELESKVRPFVDKMQPGFPVYIQNFASETAFMDSMSGDWRGAVPATFIFDSNGVLIAGHVGKLDQSGFRALITKGRQEPN